MKHSKEERNDALRRFMKNIFPMGLSIILLFTFLGIIFMIVNGAIKIGYMKVDGTITKSWTKYENEFREHNGHYSTKRVAKFYRTFSYDIDGKTYTNTTKGINPEVLPEKITILVNPDNYLESYIADDISMNFNMGIIIIILGFLFISFIIIVNVIRILIKYR